MKFKARWSMELADVKKAMVNKTIVCFKGIAYYIDGCIMELRGNKFIYLLRLHDLVANSVTIAQIEKVEEAMTKTQAYEAYKTYLRMLNLPADEYARRLREWCMETQILRRQTMTNEGFETMLNDTFDKIKSVLLAKAGEYAAGRRPVAQLQACGAFAGDNTGRCALRHDV